MQDSQRPSRRVSQRRSLGPGRHRGPHPDDERLFSKVAVAQLRVAAEEAAWLLSRGYSPASTFDLVGRHHQLEARQRLALSRAVCAEKLKQERSERLAPLEAARGKTVLLDAFNIVITLEVALSRGLLLRCRDDTLRDLAGLRRHYHPVAETDHAVGLIAEQLRSAQVARVRVLIDAPVSNSGRLRERFETLAPKFGCPVQVELVPDADRVLFGADFVVSADSEVLDASKSWVNLVRVTVAQRAHDAWIVDLG